MTLPALIFLIRILHIKDLVKHVFEWECQLTKLMQIRRCLVVISKWKWL